MFRKYYRRLFPIAASIAAMVFVVISDARRASASNLASTTRIVTPLNAVALNAAAADRTFTIASALGGGTAGFRSITFWIYFDYTATAGVISLTCTSGPSSTDNDYQPTVCSLAGGTCTLLAGGVMQTASLSADTKYEAYMAISNRDVKCIAAHSGAPGATDKITVKYQLSD